MARGARPRGGRGVRPAQLQHADAAARPGRATDAALERRVLDCEAEVATLPALPALPRLPDVYPGCVMSFERSARTARTRCKTVV